MRAVCSVLRGPGRQGTGLVLPFLEQRVRERPPGGWVTSVPRSPSCPTSRPREGAAGAVGRVLQL